MAKFWLAKLHKHQPDSGDSSSSGPWFVYACDSFCLLFRVRSSRQFDVAVKRRWRSGTVAAAVAARRAATAVRRSLSRRCRRQSLRRHRLARSSSLSRYRRSRPSPYSFSSTRKAAAIRVPSFCTSSTGCSIRARCSTCHKEDREWRESMIRLCYHCSAHGGSDPHEWERSMVGAVPWIGSGGDAPVVVKYSIFASDIFRSLV